jgi:hypothetical protein
MVTITTGNELDVVVETIEGKAVITGLRPVNSQQLLPLPNPEGLISALRSAMRNCDEQNKPAPKPKKHSPAQPDWLKRQMRGMVDGHKASVLIDGKDFAIVRHPGGRWSDNGGSYYGPVSYELADKRAPSHSGGAGVGCFRQMRIGGRPTKAEMAEWKELVTACDLAGKLVAEE